jgi:hypothetical protein
MAYKLRPSLLFLMASIIANRIVKDFGIGGKRADN